MQGEHWVQPSSSSSASGYQPEREHLGWVEACLQAQRGGRGMGRPAGEPRQELCRAEDLLLAIGPALGLINSGLKG